MSPAMLLHWPDSLSRSDFATGRENRKTQSWGLVSAGPAGKWDVLGDPGVNVRHHRDLNGRPCSLRAGSSAVKVLFVRCTSSYCLHGEGGSQLLTDPWCFTGHFSCPEWLCLWHVNLHVDSLSILWIHWHFTIHSASINCHYFCVISSE